MLAAWNIVSKCLTSSVVVIVFRMRVSQIALRYYLYTEYALKSSSYKFMLDDEAKHRRYRQYPRVAVIFFIFIFLLEYGTYPKI